MANRSKALLLFGLWAPLVLVGSWCNLYLSEIYETDIVGRYEGEVGPSVTEPLVGHAILEIFPNHMWSYQLNKSDGTFSRSNYWSSEPDPKLKGVGPIMRPIVMFLNGEDGTVTISLYGFEYGYTQLEENLIPGYRPRPVIKFTQFERSGNGLRTCFAKYLMCLYKTN